MKTTPEQFDVILKKRQAATLKVLGTKAEEYAFNDDRLYNFRKSAQLDDTTVPVALWGMAKKHLISILDLVHERLPATPEMVNEKIGDLINYLILLEAAFAENYPTKSKK